jgi:hypothetical protein
MESNAVKKAMDLRGFFIRIFRFTLHLFLFPPSLLLIFGWRRGHDQKIVVMAWNEVKIEKKQGRDSASNRVAARAGLACAYFEPLAEIDRLEIL